MPFPIEDSRESGMIPLYTHLYSPCIRSLYVSAGLLLKCAEVKKWVSRFFRKVSVSKIMGK